MAVDKPIGFVPEQEEMAENILNIQVQDNVEKANVEMMEDGSAIIGEQENILQTSFDMNLAEVLDDNTLG